MQTLQKIISNYTQQIYIPSAGWTDVIEIVLIAFVIYQVIVWIRNTRAYSLLKGILVILFVVVLAALFNMTTILWIVENIFGTAVIALVVILQPELRTAMEALGQKNIFAFLTRDGRRRGEGRFSDRTVTELVRACSSMSKVKTGALIVLRRNTPLLEYERTGIEIDAAVSSQLLINIFEKNTPLHDGAVIISGDRIVAATCYLPLSTNELDKNLGTRHRAGVGISEATDSLTIIVSEETGAISLASHGQLEHGISTDRLRARLIEAQEKKPKADSANAKKTAGSNPAAAAQHTEGGGADRDAEGNLSASKSAGIPDAEGERLSKRPAAGKGADGPQAGETVPADGTGVGTSAAGTSAAKTQASGAMRKEGAKEGDSDGE